MGPGDRRWGWWEGTLRGDYPPPLDSGLVMGYTVCTTRSGGGTFMSAINDYIDAHMDETLERLKRWCSQPSISTEKLGIEEMAQLAADDLRSSGFDVTVYPGEGFPVVLARTGPSGEGVPT